MQKFKVPAGVTGEVCNVKDQRWRRHTTKRESEFDEPIGRTRMFVTFRKGRWMLRVKVFDVRMHNGIRWVSMK